MATKQTQYTPDTSLALADTKKTGDIGFDGGSIIAFIKERFSRSEEGRRSDETRWLRAYRNYRGLYGPDVQFTETEKSRVFIKVTKTKTLAAYGQIVDVLLSNDRFPISIDPSVLPDGVVDSVHFDPKEPPSTEKQKMNIPFGEDGSAGITAGFSLDTLEEMLGAMKDDLKDLPNLKKGPGVTPTSLTFNPALVAAKKMEKKIHDQLDESNASKHLRSVAFEMALFGTGVMKGPFGTNKEYPNWNEDGKYNPLIKTVPELSSVSIWNFYWDSDANNTDECQYVIERHKLNRSQMRALKRRPFFRANVIDEVIAEGESYTKKYWEDDLKDFAPNFGVDRFEVLEYWGSVDVDMLIDNDINIPAELDGEGELQANIWYCNGKIIRLVLNPFKPSKIPYYAVPYELNPYSLAGVGIGENMDDTQTLMNGFMRMAVDNAVLSGNLVFEIDETNLVPGQDFSVHPGKVFRRQGGAPGQSLFGTKFPNVAQENLQLFDKARQLSDESTGLPSFSHGQTGVSGVGRTASGISMLMNAASGGVKTVIKNIDDYLLGPIGKAYFNFNMQFDYDPEIKGDLEVNARGTESLMANEVRSQRLMQFLQIASQPSLAPFAKFPYIIREIAKSMELDPDKVTNNMDEAMRQAALLQQQQAPAAPPEGAAGAPAPGQPPQGVAGPPGVADQTGGGGGNIGIGAPPEPGMQGFSAAPPAAAPVA
tara:strand:- start:400 stop:2523 length:2124 start_codon:yes stop_codon:yes gene_type:complete